MLREMTNDLLQKAGSFCRPFIVRCWRYEIGEKQISRILADYKIRGFLLLRICPDYEMRLFCLVRIS